MRLSPRVMASRKNGALSHGPKTVEGKKRSAMNSMRHGLLAENILLPFESGETFQLLHDQFREKFGPADNVEDNHVEELVAAVWRMRRLWAIETRLFKQASARRTEPDSMDRLAGAFSDLARGPELALLHRYEGRINRQYQRALGNLLLIGENENDQTNPDDDNSNSGST